MGWRYAVRWAVRRPRVWTATAGAALATWLAWRDHRPAWTVVVGVSTWLLALASVRVDYADEHPERAAVRAERFAAEVASIVARYESGGTPSPRGKHATMTRRELRAQRRQDEIDAIVARFEAAGRS